jgi:tRNA-specific 2-thiouridylase
VLGHHEGIHNFTVGQRKGLGIATGSPLYVININGAEGKVTVGGNDDLLSRTLIAHKLNWISFESLEDELARLSPTHPVSQKSGPQTPSSAQNQLNGLRVTANAPLRVTAKIRHRHEPAPAVLEPAPNGEVRVTFDQPQRAITPGQAVVFYDGDIVVGGGWIAETVKE